MEMSEETNVERGEEGEAVSEEVYVPNKDWFSDQFGNELTVDEVDAGSVCVTVEGTDDTMRMNCSGGGGYCSITLTPGQTSALFRYLAGIVLPKVEIEYSSGQEIGFISGRHWCSAVSEGSSHAVVWMLPIGPGSDLHPPEARALAACLLAAADEAEGAL